MHVTSCVYIYICRHVYIYICIYVDRPLHTRMLGVSFIGFHVFWYPEGRGAVFLRSALKASVLIFGRTAQFILRLGVPGFGVLGFRA